MTKNQVQKFLKSKTPKTYKNKKLNNANFRNFTHNDYKVFLHLVSKVGGVDEYGKYLQPEHLIRKHVLTAKEFSDIFNVDIHNSYKLLYKACKKLMQTSIVLNKIELNETWEINVCSTAEYNKKHGCITIEFTDRIMPYLSQVTKKFVLYNLKEISNFGSLYTTRLYELIQEYKETGWMLKSVIQLRNSFAVDNKFRQYNDFKKYTFEHACKEINYNYDMNLRFEEIKEGRKIVAVKFFFKKTLINKITNQKTGIEQNVYIKPKARIKKNIALDKLEGKLQNEPKSIKNIISGMLDKFKF